MSELFFESVKEAMQNNEPHSRWKKVQLAKVLVKVIDPLTGLPADVIIEGDPAKYSESVIYNCWSAYETAYFERNNQYHILNGSIIKYNKGIEIPTSDNALSDEALIEILDKKYMALDTYLKKATSVTPVKRLLDLATERDKPVKTVKAIEKRLAELQQAEYSVGK